jgi:hypothetical protein
MREWRHNPILTSALNGQLYSWEAGGSLASLEKINFMFLLNIEPRIL